MSLFSLKTRYCGLSLLVTGQKPWPTAEMFTIMSRFQQEGKSKFVEYGQAKHWIASRKILQVVHLQYIGPMAKIRMLGTDQRVPVSA